MKIINICNTEPWTEHAPCRGKHELFDPRGTKRRAEYAEALAICATCPFTQECWEYANRNDTRGGVWGGVIFNEHHKFEGGQTGKGREPITHGTPSGYKQHTRRGEPACTECRLANNRYAADKRNARTKGLTA
ncbi:WhiB family transcriptional regulator [Williamsia phyllosphaerae]|uniref:4Fe-4S Wbl-type domain-containing protein n=1 Tax=Williamsia phyllosphaerae TaxID=885042 RepID=A0ABQ1V5T8_9NOCA|nr:WhiB family transcriptional regulator [Williamsia phyllosphaerae]GGF38843.1 hypothetical protein GCM10007298_38190 [Williamsia phyllosphaerae]